jgi:E3 ubiquitin-protein ligase DOA10
MNNFFMQKSSIQQPQMMHAGMNSPITNSDENSDNEETMAVLNQKSSNMASSKDLNQLRKSINMLHAEQKRPSQKQTILEEQSPSMLKSISSQIPIKGRGIEKSGR